MINLHQQQTSNKNPYVNTFNRAPKMDTQAATQHHARDRQPFNTHWQQTKVEPSPSVEESQQVQKKLFRLFYVYAILIVSLYATYAGYYFYQQHSRHQQHHPQDVSATATTTETLLKSQQPLQLSLANESPGLEEQQRINFESKFESKIHLLERYIEVIALDLQETKNKLKEREKCDCNISCSFNGTRYADRSSWQNQCDICTCLSGSISCLPKKCPPVNCDDAIQLPAQCCPTCMKKCKYNNTLVRHGHKFKPAQGSGKSAKECKCHDGLIKCELPIQRASLSKALNSTLSLKSINKPAATISIQATSLNSTLSTSSQQMLISASLQKT